MKIYKHGFIGSDEPNSCSYWEHVGSREQFLQNKKEMPIDWYFHDVEITYLRNSIGHRCKEIEDVDIDNYILFTGCSHTEGVGMEADKIYPHLLAQKLNCDYYNLAMGATGIDVVLHNLSIWFSTIPKKPKALIIQWPDFTRLTTGSTIKNLQPRGLWNNDSDYHNFVNLGIDLEFFEARKLMSHYIVQAFQVPTVYFGLQKVIPFDESTIIEPIVDYARDLGHPGIKSHEGFAESIHDYLINTLCLSFCQNPEEKS
jgi:hypothetical protein